MPGCGPSAVSFLWGAGTPQVFTPSSTERPLPVLPGEAGSPDGVPTLRWPPFPHVSCSWWTPPPVPPVLWCPPGRPPPVAGEEGLGSARSAAVHVRVPLLGWSPGWTRTRVLGSRGSGQPGAPAWAVAVACGQGQLWSRAWTLGCASRKRPDEPAAGPGRPFAGRMVSVLAEACGSVSRGLFAPAAGG